jgi:hypothetical protein
MNAAVVLRASRSSAPRIAVLQWIDDQRSQAGDRGAPQDDGDPARCSFAASGQ